MSKPKIQLLDLLRTNLTAEEYQKIYSNGPALLNVHRHTWRKKLTTGEITLTQMRVIDKECKKLGVSLDWNELFDEELGAN